MHIALIDWLIIGAYLILCVLIGLIFADKGSGSIDDYFLAGRAIPWWLGSITMVASAFCIDTPIGITGLVAAHGIQGVWYAWSFVLGGSGMLGAFIFSSLLRRSEVMTTAELVELRYSGKEASILRFFKGVYFGIFANAITLGWIIRAVWTVTDVVLGWNPHLTLAVILLLTLFYTTMSGMWGIVVTDFLQFFIGFAGLIVLTIFAVNQVGGVQEIVNGFRLRYGAGAVEKLQFFPRPGSPFFETFIVFITMKWWGNPSPAIHQRIVSSKNERHASISTLLFSIIHFAINYWPMILIAMASLVLYPTLKSPEDGYPMLVVSLLPPGLMGLMIASMMAAFMSTVDTHINYGASYIVNDIYRRFIKKEASQKHYVNVSKISTILMLLISVMVAYGLDSVKDAWYYMAMLTAGYGFVIVARWFWWRINAWSEITALITSLVGSTIFSFKFARFFGYHDSIKNISFGRRFIIILIFCTIAWVAVTIFTEPSDEETLVKFCRKVKPFPAFWGPIKEKYPDIEWNPHLLRCTLYWLFGSIAVLAVCFGIGNIIFFEPVKGGLLLLLALTIFVAIYSTWVEV